MRIADDEALARLFALNQARGSTLPPERGGWRSVDADRGAQRLDPTLNWR
jgi:hypothetical protein